MTKPFVSLPTIIIDPDPSEYDASCFEVREAGEFVMVDVVDPTGWPERTVAMLQFRNLELVEQLAVELANGAHKIRVARRDAPARAAS